jgi:hypothetical protein
VAVVSFGEMEGAVLLQLVIGFFMGNDGCHIVRKLKFSIMIRILALLVKFLKGTEIFASRRRPCSFFLDSIACCCLCILFLHSLRDIVEHGSHKSYVGEVGKVLEMVLFGEMEEDN